MILSGKEILKEVENKKIIITDFDKKRLGPNSYNLRLGKKLLYYTDDILDMKTKPNSKIIQIPDEGLILEPGKLYLGETMEKAGSSYYVPMLEGRSSIGRLGLTVHVTAGFGDVGFEGVWTLEMVAFTKIRIYPEVEIAQIYFHTIQGDFDLYNGKYNNLKEVYSSDLYKDF